MTEEKVREVVQLMIDNNESPEDIKRFVKKAKNFLDSQTKEDQTQSDATVTEESTASTLEDGSSDSLQLDDEAQQIVNSYHPNYKNLEADIKSGKITNQQVIDFYSTTSKDAEEPSVTLKPTRNQELQGFYDKYRREGETNEELMQRISPVEMRADVTQGEPLSLEEQMLAAGAQTQTSYMGSDVKAPGSMPTTTIDGVVYNPNDLFGNAYTLADGSTASQDDIKRFEELKMLYEYQQFEIADPNRTRSRLAGEYDEMSDIEIQQKFIEDPKKAEEQDQQVAVVENQFNFKDYQNYKSEKTTNDFSKYVAENTADITARMQAEFNERAIGITDKAELEKLKEVVQEKYSSEYTDFADKKWDAWVESYKPKYSLWDGKLKDISLKLDEKGFADLSGPEKKQALQEVLDEQMRLIGDVPQAEDMKNEYWAHFYDKLSTDPEKGYTQFAIKDIATQVGNDAEKELKKLAKNYKTIYSSVGGGTMAGSSTTTTPMQQAVRDNPSLATAMKYRDRILDNPEAMSESGFVNYFRGLTSMEGYKYIPFAGGAIDMAEKYEILKLSKKENRTQSEEDALALYQLNNLSNQKVSELSTGYNAGKQTAESLPFMAEIIATGGIYSTVKEGTQKGIKKALVKRIDDTLAKNMRFKKGTSQMLFVPKNTKFQVIDKASDAIGVIAAATAQSTAQPQRYLAGTFENMTPQMAFAYTDQSDGLVNTITEQGDGFTKAFSKAYATNSLEYITERMGTLAPSAIKKLIPKGTSDEFVKRLSLGVYMRKFGLNKAEAVAHFTKNQAGWNGVLGEISEEMYNIPLSNLVNGQGLNFGDFGMQEFKEMAISIGSTSLAFGGGSVAYNNSIGRQNPAYYVDNQRFEDKKAALKKLKQLKSDGKLDANTDIEVRNDFVAFDEFSNYLEQNGLSNDIIKTGGKGVPQEAITATEVEMLNEIESPELRSQLEEISGELGSLEQKKQDILNRPTKGKQDVAKQAAQIEEIDAEISRLTEAKNTVLSPVKESIIEYKKEERYKQQLANAKEAQKSLNKTSPIKTRFVEAPDAESAAELMRQDVLNANGLQQVEGTPGSSDDGNLYIDINTGNEVVLDQGSLNKIGQVINESKTAHGFAGNFLDPTTGERLLVINKQAAVEGMGMNVASHEFFHEFLRNTLRNNPEVSVALGRSLQGYLANIDPKQVRDSDFRNRLAAYQNAPESIQTEETMAIFADALANGTMQYNENAMTKLGDIVRRIMQGLGMRVKFKSGRDVFNFIKDYNKAIESGKGLNRGLRKTAIEGARISGNIKAEAQLLKNMVAGFNKQIKADMPDVEDLTLDDLEAMGVRFSKEGLPAEKMSKEELAKSVNDTMAPLINLKKKRNNGTITEQEERMLDRMQADIPGRAAFFYTGMAQDAFSRSLNLAPTEDIRNDLLNNKEDIMSQLLFDPGTATAKARTVLGLLQDFDPAKHKYENAAAYVNQFFKRRSQEIFARRGVEDVATKSQDQDEAIKKKVEGMTGPSSDQVEAKTKGRVLGADLGLHKYDQDGNRVDDLRKEADKQLDMLLEQDSPTFAESPSFTAPFISEVSGVPAKKITDKTANLNQHLGPARRFNAKYKDMLIAMRPRHYTVKMVQSKSGEFEARPDKAIGIPNKIKSLGYNKGTRKSNLTPWHIKPISSSEFENFIAPRNTDGTVNESDRNIEQNNKGWLSLLDKVMSNQEIRMAAIDRGLPMQWIGRMRDGNSNYLFSKEIREMGTDNEAVFYARLPELGSQPMTSDPKSIQNALMLVYPDIMTRGTAGKIAKSISKFIKQYKTIEQGFAGLDKVPPRTFEEFLADNINLPEFNITKLLDVKQDGKLMKNSDLYDNIEFVKNQRASVVNMGNYMIQDLGMKPSEVIRYMLAYLKPMYAGASKIGRGSIGVKEDGTLFYKEGFESGTPRGMVFESVGDFIKNAVNKIEGVNIDMSKVTDAGGSIQGKKMLEVYSADVSALPQSAKGMMNKLKKLGEKEFFKAVDKETKEVRQLIDVMMRYFVDQVKDGNLGRNDLAMMMLSMNAGLDTPMRRAANLAYIGSDVENMDPSDMTKETVAYEHMIPANYMAVKILDQYMNKGGIPNLDEFYKNYNVAIISAKMDDVLKKQGLLSMMPVNYDLDMPSWTRYYNFRTQGFSDVVGLKALDPKAADVSSTEAFEKANKLLIDSPVDLQNKKNYDKAINNARLFSKETPSKGMSTFDFDETLIDKGENFIIAKKDGQEVKISSGQWPIQGPQYAADGWKFDFTDFVNVRGGVDGPLLQKMKNQIAKYGSKNVYVLTARPAEAATAIHGWLKTKGINIPLKNITGLGNSTGDAKAQWFIDKYAEGYNDMYFVDDALPNVEAVKHVFDQLDIKGKSVIVRPRFSLDPSVELDNMLERSKGVDRNAVFNRVQARNKGKVNKVRQLFIPPSADDFEGLMYYNMGKGKQGEADAKFFKNMFYDPYNRADRELDMYKQTLREDVQAIKKRFPEVAKKLKKDFSNTGYTNEQAMRIYLYHQVGYDVPGMSEADVNNVAQAVALDPEMTMFANLIRNAMKLDEYVQPTVGWNASSFNGDMSDAAKIKRDGYMQEWNENIEATFTPEMLNKLEAIHGSGYRSALEDSIARMKSGSNRPTIKDKRVNGFLDWLNGSVGAIMFFNARSAVLQTLSTVNFINFEDNNIFAAAKAFANQKQYWADFVMLFNSPMLRQRRGGLQSDLNASELAQLAEQGGVKAVIGRLLEFGFTPTQIADSFAISAGGSTYYRNRVNKYVSEGMSQSEAEAQAFIDFQEIAEATQQSSRPDKISQEQASVLGRLILAFQNTPMQYNRLIKKAALDLMNGRGDTKANISRILYYGAVQNIIFSSLQTALFAVLFDDDDQEEEFLDTKIERITNGTLDSLLRGSGIYGAVLSTVKNTIMKYMSEREKGMRADNGRVLIEALNVSPPLGSKARKLYSAMTTDKWNQDIYDKIPLYNIDNPIWDAAGNTVEAVTNVPAGRIQRKISNLKAASDNENATWQRLALFLGWDKWGLGIERPEEIEEAKEEVKEEKKEQKKKERKEKEAEVKEEKEKDYLKDQQKEKEENKKPRCAAATRSGSRCKGTPVDGTYCTIHTKVEKRSDGKEVQCKKVKSNGDRCKMKTSSKSGLCYYHD